MSAESYLKEDEIRTRLLPVIIGGDVLAYSYVREFNRAYGIERCICIMSNDIKMMTSSKFTDCIIVPDSSEEHNLLQILRDLSKKIQDDPKKPVPLLLGTDDSVAAILSANRKELSALGYVIPYEDISKIEKLSKKHVFYELCEELDIPYPKTWYFECGTNGPDELPWDEFSLPIIVKPSDSSAYKHSSIKGKRKAYEVYTLDEFKDIWRNLRSSDYDGEIIIQDFIPGGDEALWIINMFTDENGDIRVISSGDMILQDHCPTAIGNPITILGCKNEKLIEYVSKIQERVKFIGWSTFDIKYDTRSDDYIFFEMNIRPGRSSYYISLGGVNFIKPIVEYFVMGKEIPYQEAYRPFVYNIVPKYVIKRSVPDRELVKRTLKVLSETEPNPDPLLYDKDSFTHNMWARIMRVNQIRKFKKYLWDTDGKQYSGD